MKPAGNKKGMALLLALVFAVVLLQMAIAYSQLTGQAKPQTVQIDERIKLDYLAHGLTELALLKFQLYPADYYACWEAAQLGDSAYLRRFTIEAPEFTVMNFNDSRSSFNNAPVDIQLASMAILTDNKWKTEALLVQAWAAYVDQFDRNINKDAVRLVSLERVPRR
jgi:hypothetical protein